MGFFVGCAGWDTQEWAGQAISPRRIPEYINIAYRQAMTGRLGPAYLDLPGEVRDFLPRDGILVVDGQEILNYGRQSIPT